MVSTIIPSVNIRPEVSILSILKSVNYKAWYAIAEFVDNAIQSALSSHDALLRIEGDDYRLRVSIEIDSTPGQEKITIRDNAGGIGLMEFAHAFRPASLPVDRSGLSEFGMGMKSAACWFADFWTVRTTAIDEATERTVVFDVQRIVEQQIEDIPIRERTVQTDAHYTELTLTQLNQLPQTKTITKIKSHLSSMYRVFLREGLLDLVYNGQSITYDDPEILVAPYYKTLDANSIQWKKEIICEIAPGMRITGFAALLDKGSTTNAGFALLRRNRVILGSDDEGYRPKELFGHPNSFIYQRLWGELHLEGFEVSHTKDGIQWNYHEEQVLQTLKLLLNEQPTPLLEQAKEYKYRDRANGTPNNGQRPKPPSPQLELSSLLTSPPQSPPFSTSSEATYQSFQSETPLQVSVSPSSLPHSPKTKKRELQVRKIFLNNETWTVRIELNNEVGIGDWFSIQGRSDATQELEIRLSLEHPFTKTFCQVDDISLEPLIRITASMAVAEINAQKVGIQKSGVFRKFVNQVLRDGFIEE